MKAIKKITMALAIIAAGLFMQAEKSQAQVSVSFQVFYDELSPYGHWVSYPQYGYVWIPAGVAGFSPYGSGGHWVFTEFGWTWVSDYPWGWAPFHYGRWHYDDFYGWLWVPGNEWGPAWVCWRRSPGFYGWAPIPPGISLQVAFGPRYSIPHNRWVFVNERYISNPRIAGYYAPRNNNGTIIQKSTVINNTYVDKSNHTTFVSGPRRDDVQKITGSEIRPVKLKESSKPGQSLNNNELSVYRPAIQKGDANGTKPAPRKVENIKDIKPANAEKPAPKQQQDASPSKNNVKEQPKKNIKEEPQQQQAKPEPRQNVQPADKAPQQEKPAIRDRDINKGAPRDNRIEKRTQPAAPHNNTRQEPQRKPHDNKRKNN